MTVPTARLNSNTTEVSVSPLAAAVTKNFDDSSKFFVTAAASGETLTSVVFEFTRTVGTVTEVYQTVTLTNAMVSSVKTVNGDGRPAEEISFTFQKIEYQNKDGAAAAPASWR